MSQKFIKHEVDHLEHIPIGYIKDRHYAIVTRDGSKFFSNYTCYHKSCDIVIQAMSEKDREVLLLVQKAYSVNGPRELSKFFYLNEKEFDAFCQESLKYIENADSDEWREACKEMQLTQDENHQVAWNMTRDHNSLRETFPRDRVSDEDIEKIKKNFKSRTMKDKNGMNVTSLKKYLALSSLFEANYKRAKLYLDNLEMFQEGKRGRQFIMRMINDKRINDFDEWFLCRGEIYEFVDIIMQQIDANRKQSDLLFDWISEYEDNDKMFVPVKEFEKYLNILKIDKNRVIFVPDVDFMKDWIDIPLQINPLGSTVYMTEGIKVYPKIQAQLKMFESFACDIDWVFCFKNNPKETEKVRQYVIQAMKWVDPNYTDANHFDKEKHKQFKSQFFAINITQKRKTPFACFMNKKFDGFTSTDDFRKIVKDNILAKNDKFDLLGFIPSDDKIEIWKARFILIVVWLSNVLHDEKELFLNVIKALTINCGFLNFEKEADIKKWVDGGLKMSEEYVNFDKLRDFEKMKEKTKKKEEILKNALKVPKSSAPKLLQQALKKDETPKDCQFPNFKRGFLNNTSTEDEPKIEPVKVTTKVVRKTASDVVDKLITYIINQSGFEEYTPLEDLDEGIRKHMVDYLDEIEADIYWRMMNNETFSKLLMHKLEKYFDLKIEKGQKLVRKKRDAPVKKPENAPKIVETKETIDAIEENKKLKLKIDEMTTKLEESQRREQVLEGIQIKLRAELEEVGININEREEAAKELEKNSKLLLNKIKQDYREEIRKYKEEAQTRENRIQQLQDEQKENREFLRKEREKLYAEAEKNSRLANESVRKMKTELENAKFHENNHLSKISELLKENSQLKTHIEILEEKLDSDKNSEEISQDIQKLDVSSSDC